MTTKSLTQEVNGRSDLAGKAVGTWEDYVPKLEAEGIAAVGYKWWVGSRLQSCCAACTPPVRRRLQALVLTAATGGS